jgi:hypothetical protein
MFEFGINVAFPPKRVNISDYYERVFKLMCQQGVRVCRIWLSDFSFNYYSYCGKTYDLNMSHLVRIVSIASIYNIRFIPVLFDFNEFSTTNVHWSNYEHTFRTSFLSKYLNRPGDFFLPEHFEIGLSKLSGLRSIFNEDNLYAWELFNEVDLTKEYSLQAVTRWAADYSSKIREYSSKPIYISFSNPKHLEEAVRSLQDVNVALHIYQWPYKDIYKNLIFWQKKYPSHWIMECGSPKATSQDMLMGLLASFILCNHRKVPLPWFWEHILSLQMYDDLKSIMKFISQHIEDGEHFEFVGELGSNRRSINLNIIRNNLKLSGIRNLLFKARVTARTMASKSNSICLLRFESSKMLVAIETELAPYLSINQNQFRLLDSYCVKGIKVTLYSKNKPMMHE